jgi:hypothetical protein
MPTGEAMRRFNKPKSDRVNSPLGKVVSRRTKERAWVFKGSRVPLGALFEALADGESVGEFVKRLPELQAEDIKNILRGVGVLVEYQLHERSLTLRAIKWGAEGALRSRHAGREVFRHREGFMSKRLSEIAVEDFVLTWFRGVPKPLRLEWLRARPPT